LSGAIAFSWHESFRRYYSAMSMTASQIAKTKAVAENLAVSEEVRGKAAHALSHDDQACPACVAWRGRPDIFKDGDEPKRGKMS
jgi:hypothetical protein